MREEKGEFDIKKKHERRLTWVTITTKATKSPIAGAMKQAF